MTDRVEAAATPTPTGGRGLAAVAAVLSAMALVVLDAGMVNVALPSLAEAFGLAPADAVGVVTAYQAGLIMALLPLGALGERFGHRRIFTLSVALFALASAAAAAAPTAAGLLAARFVQGLGGAGVMALGVALLRQATPAGRLGAAIGWNAITVALASAAAPTLGSLILMAMDVRALFLIAVPMAALTLLTTRALPASAGRPIRLDLISMGLNALAFGLLILGAQAAATTPGEAAGLLIAALAAAAALVWREAPKSEPLLPLDLLRARGFRLSVAASVCFFIGQSLGLLALPFLLVSHLRYGAVDAALHLTAWPLSVAVAAALSGRLADRLPGAWLCALGAAGLAAGLAACGAWPTAPPPALLLFIAVSGLGFGLFQSPNNRNMFLAAPAARSGAAGGMQGAARVSGQTLGALAMTLMLGRLPLATALPAAFALAAVLALAAAILSLKRGLE